MPNLFTLFMYIFIHSLHSVQNFKMNKVTISDMQVPVVTLVFYGNPTCMFCFLVLLINLYSRNLWEIFSEKNMPKLLKIQLRFTIEKTRNAWQSLAYSPLGAKVSPPSRY